MVKLEVKEEQKTGEKYIQETIIRYCFWHNERVAEHLFNVNNPFVENRWGCWECESRSR